MKNGSIRDIQAQTSEDVKQALSALQQDPSFREYEKQLAEQGYNASSPRVQQTGINRSKITVPYNNGSTGKNITAEYVNGTIKNVKIEEEKDEQNNVFWYAAAFALIALLAYLAYRRYSKKKAVVRECAPLEPEYVDYRSDRKSVV